MRYGFAVSHRRRSRRQGYAALCAAYPRAPHIGIKHFPTPKKREELSPEMRRFTMLEGNAKHTKAAAPADEGFSLSRRALCAFRKPCFISHKLAAFNFIAIFLRLSNAAFTKPCKLPYMALRCFAAPRRPPHQHFFTSGQYCLFFAARSST